MSGLRKHELVAYVLKNTNQIGTLLFLQAITSFYPDAPKTIKKDIAVWIIVVSAIAGVVLLIILVVVFKMVCTFELQTWPV
jgi:t-SNARE complex subunit (syntaxin)